MALNPRFHGDYSFEAKLKDCDVPIKFVVIFGKWNKELKDTFYFDHYQVRHINKIDRYWNLCLVAWTLTYWIKQNLSSCKRGCLSY